MRYTITILLLVTSLLCRGQHYQSFRAYQYEGNDTAKKWLMWEKTFNKIGKVIKEISYNRPVFQIGKKKADLSVYSSSLRTYRDTLLISDFTTYRPNEIEVSIDSEYTFYTYGAQNKISKKVHRQHQGVRASGQEYGGDDPQYITYEWQEPEVTNYSYTYGINGLLTNYREDTKCYAQDHYYTYDVKNRMIIDSTVYDGHLYNKKGKAIPCGSMYGHQEILDKRTYTAHGYKKHVYSEMREYTMEYSFDDRGRIIRLENVNIMDNGQPDGTKHITTYIYDMEGRLLKEGGSEAGNSLYQYNTVYQYDRFGKVVKKSESGYSSSTTTLYVYK